MSSFGEITRDSVPATMNRQPGPSMVRSAGLRTFVPDPDPSEESPPPHAAAPTTSTSARTATRARTTGLTPSPLMPGPRTRATGR